MVLHYLNMVTHDGTFYAGMAGVVVWAVDVICKMLDGLDGIQYTIQRRSDRTMNVSRDIVMLMEKKRTI